MNKYQHIILIGMPACGKSSIGTSLSAKLSIPLYDTDLMLEEQYSQSITNIFIDIGEAQFRMNESAKLQDVIGRESGVISLGGGGVLAPPNRDIIKDNNLVFYIKASVPTLVRNLSDDSRRPLLEGYEDKGKRLTELLNQRAAIYNECCNFVINVDELSPHEAAQKIINEISNENII
ncbi:MAG: shikimate kinase [Gammaproteobacteria bacterium]|nr:shikimate kinase [Gammaproteobacteria bacterium]